MQRVQDMAQKNQFLTMIENDIKIEEFIKHVAKVGYQELNASKLKNHLE